MRHVILVSSLFTAGVLTSAMAGQSIRGNGDARPATGLVAQATVAAPQSRIEGDEVMDGAVAAAVIGAVSAQFGSDKVTVKLDGVDVQPSSIRDRAVSGDGRVQIGGDAEWIAFTFKAQYDTEKAAVSYPQLTLGVSTAAKAIGIEDPMSRTLLAHVDRVVSQEFAGQPVVIAFDKVEAVSAGERYVRVEASGIADFRAEGTTPAIVQALYDRKTGKWVNVGYELGTTANWADVQTVAVAL